MSIKEYLPCKWLTSACTTMDTSLGEGRGDPSTERKRGREMAVGEEIERVIVVHVSTMLSLGSLWMRPHQMKKLARAATKRTRASTHWME